MEDVECLVGSRSAPIVVDLRQYFRCSIDGNPSDASSSFARPRELGRALMCRELTTKLGNHSCRLQPRFRDASPDICPTRADIVGIPSACDEYTRIISTTYFDFPYPIGAETWGFATACSGMVGASEYCATEVTDEIN